MIVSLAVRSHYVSVAIVHLPRRTMSDSPSAATVVPKFEMVPVELMWLVTFAFVCLVWVAWSFEFDAVDLGSDAAVEQRSY